MSETNKAKPSVKKFHVVRTKAPADVAKYIIPCPEDKKNDPDEGPIREFQSLDIYCTNFKESFFVLHKDHFKIKWETIKEGVEGGMVEGLEL